ncbi:MAG: DNA-binding MarR family transcriptional regulator [Kiritimatiellia bacterium]|jgi:DNA-binding MarR family transcriptional regulator
MRSKIMQKDEKGIGNGAKEPASAWTFMTNHTHILVCLHRDPSMTVRNMALAVGITERSVQRILGDLESSGVVTRSREGRRNRYDMNRDYQLRHPLEARQSIRDLLELLG